jgi:hypothetical protein
MRLRGKCHRSPDQDLSAWLTMACWLSGGGTLAVRTEQKLPGLHRNLSPRVPGSRARSSAAIAGSLPVEVVDSVDARILFKLRGVKIPRYPLSLRSLGFRERVGRGKRQMQNTSVPPTYQPRSRKRTRHARRCPGSLPVRNWQSNQPVTGKDPAQPSARANARRIGCRERG